MPIDKCLGYEYIYNPNHPLSNKSGKVYVHRIVASEKLGRTLKSDDHVHHIDGNKINNNPENLQIVNSSEHAKIENENRGHKKEILNCISCGTELKVSKKKSVTKLCLDCCIKSKRKFNPTKNELRDLVWKYPIIKVAKMFGVSNKAVAKRCKLLNIDRPRQGYWIKKL